MSQPIVDQMWECPKCGTQTGMGQPARMKPPTCQWGHEPTEMEQITAGRWTSEGGPDV